MIDTSINNPQTKKAEDALGSPEELLRLWKEEGNLVAGLFLGQAHHFGDEEHGIFRNPEKAKEIYLEVGEPPEKGPFLGDFCPETAKYILTGSSQDVEAVKVRIDKLAAKVGSPEGDFGLYIPVGALMKVLVGSRYYEGNVLYSELENPEKLVITAELDSPEKLLYAFRQAYPSLTVEMETKDEQRNLK